MRTDAYWLGVVSGFVLVGAVVEMVRRRYLRGRFALVWIAMGTGSALLALFPVLLDRAAVALGVKVPLNLLLFLGSIAMLIMIMQLSSEAGRLRERTRILAEEVALLHTAVDSWTPAQPEATNNEALSTNDDNPPLVDDSDRGIASHLLWPPRERMKSLDR